MRTTGIFPFLAPKIHSNQQVSPVAEKAGQANGAERIRFALLPFRNELPTKGP